MSVIANELSSSLESFLLKNTEFKATKEGSLDNSISNSFSHGGYFILDHEPNGNITSSPRFSPQTNAVSIPYSSKFRRSARVRLGSTTSPSPSSLTSTTANGSISNQSLKESLNKTISSFIEGCQEKIIIHNNSPSSSYSFTKHSTIIYSPTKSSSVSSSFNKLKLSQSSLFSINKIKPSSPNKESKLSEITFGLKKNDIHSNHRRKASLDDTILLNIENKKEQKKKEEEKKEEQKKEEQKKENDEMKQDQIKNVEKKEEESLNNKNMEYKKEMEEVKVVAVNEKENEVKLEKPSVDIENKKANVEEEKEKEKEKEKVKKVKAKKTEEKNNNKSPSLAKLEAKKDKEILKKKKATHKKTLSLPNILSPLTPLTGMNEVENPLPEKIKRRKSVNFSVESFKSICIFTTTDKPEEIKNSKVEIKIDDPESDAKDKDYSELRNYENAWSPVPRNVIHIQKFKSSKAKHVQYELPVSIQSFKLVPSNPEETEDKLSCLKVTLNVQNLNYEKKVVIRYTVNKWKSFKEIEAKYVKCIRESSKDEGYGIKNVVGLDRFVARIPVGEHFILEEKPGHICNQRPTKMLLVARYEVNNNTYWDNNDFTDYHIELVRINAGYDVPRVSKHGKPIPCPGCCMSSKQSNIIEKQGNEVKNNKRTVRKIGGVFGNFTEAVGKNNDRTNFMADKSKVSLYMGVDGNGSSITSSSRKDSKNKDQKKKNEVTEKLGTVTKVLTAEPESVIDTEKVKLEKLTTENQSVPNKKIHSMPYSYGSPSMGGSPMYSMLNDSSINTNTNTNTNTNNVSSSDTSSFSYYNSSSKYNPPVSTTSSLYPGSSMSMGTPTTGNSPYGSSYYSFDSLSSQSKYEPPNYGGIGYDPSVYGGYPSQSSSILSTNPSNSSNSTSSSASKYNPPNEYPNSSFSKYDPPSYYNGRSYSTPISNNSLNASPYSFSPYGTDYSKSTNMYENNNLDSNTSEFSSYNFGTNLIKKAKSVNVATTHDYSPYNYNGNRTNSKYDIPFSTYSSFGDNFSSYYNMSPSAAVTY
ncbi:hypothetical protein BCR32DRAFT_276314 [Anaeromyces robustus]|uniref:CBM21 domain-containing protein n=1 Tax=Anaeromyces robustus TaxID=1754192 RepID=A0A1Y1XJ34_9FUNG|nr:hypothetical protein BCR32DRAFT_276314 [Anaeromyces robustus]|eukprot:ORX85416.1 hypothetical protein BCR32DRAFT_276314 [Anaeromyces robustus]